jgi:hypothetical protein
MDQYLLIPFLGGWTSHYQLFWCSPGVQGFDTLPCESSHENESSIWKTGLSVTHLLSWACTPKHYHCKFKTVGGRTLFWAILFCIPVESTEFVLDSSVFERALGLDQWVCQWVPQNVRKKNGETRLYSPEKTEIAAWRWPLYSWFTF